MPKNPKKEGLVDPITYTRMEFLMVFDFEAPLLKSCTI
jgi:hypothetical protein